MKNLKFFTKALLMNVNFFFINILKTTHDRVQESVKNALSRTLLHLVFKIFRKKNITIIKSAFLNNLRFFTNKCTHLLRTSNFGLQGPQNAALQQRYSPCQSKNSISAEKLKINPVFRTNMDSNAAVTLHLEDLGVQNYLFLKDMCIC